jgi:hypothetical protein
MSHTIHNERSTDKRYAGRELRESVRNRETGNMLRMAKRGAYDT